MTVSEKALRYGVAGRRHMTALEQLAKARSEFITADRLVRMEGALSAWNTYRRIAYAQWLEACVRFRKEGRGEASNPGGSS
jgi:hypothetical protein